MTLRADPKYTNRRTYVVKLRADVALPLLAGRLENLITGRQIEFGSGSELLGSLARDLLEQAEEQRPGPPGVER